MEVEPVDPNTSVLTLTGATADGASQTSGNPGAGMGMSATTQSPLEAPVPTTTMMTEAEGPGETQSGEEGR
nr:hypothetical protein BaRGS_010181 [Batillaria attramentaria]